MIFIFLITFTSVFAQDSVSVLVDSLTLKISNSEKSRIAQKIAWELRTQDWERSQYYLEYSKKNAIDSKSEDLLAEHYEKAAYIYYEKEVFDITLFTLQLFLRFFSFIL